MEERDTASTLCGARAAPLLAHGSSTPCKSCTRTSAMRAAHLAEVLGLNMRRLFLLCALCGALSAPDLAQAMTPTLYPSPAIWMTRWDAASDAVEPADEAPQQLVTHLGGLLSWWEATTLEAEPERLEPGWQQAFSASLLAWWEGFKPDPRFRISSRFGMRYHPVLKRHKLHNGLDLAAPTGTPIHAAAGGHVTHAGWKGANGNLIMVEHDGGYLTAYAHLSRVDVARGARVERGDVLGAVGTTGRSTGPHLHFVVKHNGEALDPLKVKEFQYDCPIPQLAGVVARERARYLPSSASSSPRASR